MFHEAKGLVNAIKNKAIGDCAIKCFAVNCGFIIYNTKRGTDEH